MEYTFCELKKKSVINIRDGKKIGKVTDISLSYPDLKINYLIVSPSKLNLFSCDTIKIRPCDIENIGEDAILVKFQLSPQEKCKEYCEKACDFACDECDE